MQRTEKIIKREIEKLEEVLKAKDSTINRLQKTFYDFEESGNLLKK